jgi:Cu+-exporting ATPase
VPHERGAVTSVSANSGPLSHHSPLVQADLGIALGSGTDIAIESGHIVLISGDLGGLVRALRLSRVALGVIRQNLFWAFF